MTETMNRRMFKECFQRFQCLITVTDTSESLLPSTQHSAFSSVTTKVVCTRHAATYYYPKLSRAKFSALCGKTERSFTCLQSEDDKIDYHCSELDECGGVKFSTTVTVILWIVHEMSQYQAVFRPRIHFHKSVRRYSRCVN